MQSTLLVGTRKGLIPFSFKNETWQAGPVSFDGVPVSIAYADPRNGRWWACLDHGHWGVKLHYSDDKGKTWTETEPPAYPEGYEVKEGVPAITRYLWSMTHGGKQYPNRLWIGTEPGGLFKSEDNGQTWQLVESLWNHPTRKEGWFGGGRDHPGIHSIIVDPRNEDRLLVGISCAGVFESLDSGTTWHIRNKGMRADFLPDPDTEVGQDPHIVVAAPSNPDVLWQQNHCGIYVSNDGAATWKEVSEKDGPANFGFVVAVAEDNPQQAWVAPAVSDMVRVAVDKAMCISRTDDGGKTWKALRNGLPQENCYDIVYRHGLVNKGDHLVFGTTTGNLFHSRDRGENWEVVSNYLPMVYSLHFV